MVIHNKVNKGLLCHILLYLQNVTRNDITLAQNNKNTTSVIACGVHYKFKTMAY